MSNVGSIVMFCLNCIVLKVVIFLVLHVHVYVNILSLIYIGRFVI